MTQELQKKKKRASPKLEWIQLCTAPDTGHWVFYCSRCDKKYLPTCPCSLGMMDVMMRQWIKDHRYCKVDAKIVAQRMKDLLIDGIQPFGRE